MDRRKIDPRTMRLLRDTDQKLYMETPAGKEGPINAKWAFPLTHPEQYVVISHESGEFVALLENYRRLDAQSLELLMEELEENYFLPRITHIDEIDDKFQIMVWTVVTDKGPRQFEVRSARRDIRWLNDHHVVIQDVDGNRYEIGDLRQLDAKSRELIEMEV